MNSVAENSNYTFQLSALPSNNNQRECCLFDNLFYVVGSNADT